MTIEHLIADDNAAVPNSNLGNSGELRATARDVTAEARAKGHFNTASAHIPTAEANNNPDIVARDGMRIYAGGDYQPTDLLVIDGMEVTYEMAQSLGLIKGSDFTSPQEIFTQDAEVVSGNEPVDDRPAEAILLGDQLTIAFGDQAADVLQVVGNDIAQNGEISEHGLDFFQRHMNMSPQQAKETVDELEGVGNRVLQDFLNNGDGYEIDRVAFLANLAETGTRDQKETVRNVWFKAATGQITREAAIEAFNRLVEPYA
ncbi:hypothetical protein [Ruegeria arenilitoris]|uniref:hypothetical protein n=1 Tax=Ruegeria arenilitoris TaxID=1173585 RepID=UPI00148051A2|nr:hypothetical protein [Ruegeria arenilitoris]